MEGNDSGDDFSWNTEDELEISGILDDSSSNLPTSAAVAIVCDDKENNDSKDDLGWNSEDELEILGIPNSSSRLPAPAVVATVCNDEGTSSSSASKLVRHFVDMGFPDKLVVKAIEEIGESSSEAILDKILLYMALQSPSEEPGRIDSDQSSSGYDETLFDSDSDINIGIWSDDEDEENTDGLSDSEKKLQMLEKMGYPVDEAREAMHRCGPDASIAVLADFIYAAQMARAEAPDLPAEIKPRVNYTCSQSGSIKRRLYADQDSRKRHRGSVGEAVEMIRLPKPMIGFGLPDQSNIVTARTLPQQALGPPFFYYENVAMTPKGVWEEISKCLFYIEPEFVDSKHFCAAARKRGYIHNLPIKGRFPLRPLLSLTISETFPLSQRWWPSWDKRTNFNCLQTAVGSAKLQERIRKAVETYDGVPPEHAKKYVIDQCKKWNLLWTGKNKVAPLEPDEYEMLLGFPKNHTRGGGISRTDRYKALGNSFQVNTVAYHLSVLKPLFPSGINVLSLFSGIGGAEVALHRLGIPLKNVVSVEISETNRNIVRSWWEQTNQMGRLIDFDDVRILDANRIESLIGEIGGFDLVIGGSPCNNLAGSNRVSRDGLDGSESILFYEYVRILNTVQSIMRRD